MKRPNFSTVSFPNFFVFFFLVSLFISTSAWAVDCFVADTPFGDDSNPLSNDCSASATPCESIQTAIDSAANCTTIFITEGVYPEDVTIDDLVAVTLLGGFPITGSGPDYTLAARDPVANGTTINPTSPAISISLSSSIVIDGLILQNGTADTPPVSSGDECGGGLIIDQSSDVQIIDVAMNDNFSTEDGGGFCIIDSTDITMEGTVEFNRCTVVNNTADDDGGGGWITGTGVGKNNSRIDIINCEISNNLTFDDDGGGIWTDDVTINFDMITMVNNEADDNGGGLHLTDTVFTLDNSTIGPNNRAEGSDDGDGGGIRLDTCANPGNSISNTIITGNSADNDGGGIDCDISVLNIVDSDIIMNRTDEGDGGGIEAEDECTITITGSNINQNSADENGGGIALDESRLFMWGSNVNNNVALDSDGGGIFADDESEITLGEHPETGVATNVNENSTGPSVDGDGGGIYIDTGSELRTLAATSELGRTNISNNTSADEGGGISVHDGSSLILTDVNIELNFSEDDGGGINADEDGNDGTDGVILNFLRVRVNRNRATDNGGGMFCDNCNFSIVDSFFVGNTSTADSDDPDSCGGGGIALVESDSDGTLVNTFIVDNTATGEPPSANGGGICIAESGDSDVTCTHCTISNNRAVGFGGGVFVFGDDEESPSFTSINSNIILNLAGTPAGVTEVGEDIFCDSVRADVEGDNAFAFVTLQTSNVGSEVVPRDVFIGGPGDGMGAGSFGCQLVELLDNISANPDYIIDPELRAYRLSATSPSRDAAAGLADPDEDFEGDSRITFGPPDIGADEFVPTEAGFCFDGVDNDLDGDEDCEDPECVNDPNCIETGPVECSDGIDNNLNGQIDCLDGGCFGAANCQEGAAFAGTCDDSINNNPLQNALTDCVDPACATDPVCAPPSEGDCDDGIDEDLDGDTDCDDADCAGDPACPAPVEDCDNAADDDGDGDVDCDDNDCVGDPACPGPGEDCDNDADDDGDGDEDCDDADCAGSAACTETGGECGNGIDDDEDGATDCDDSNCTGSAACTETGGECSDGIDNDGDGLQNCLDPDCDNVGGCELGFEDTCDDNFDNDGDGLSDCDDPNCDLDVACDLGGGGGGGCSIGAVAPQAGSALANALVSLLPALGAGLWLVRRRKKNS